MRERERERKRERQRHRRKEKQAPCQEPDVGLNPETPGLHPGPKAGAKLLSQPGSSLLSHPGIPNFFIKAGSTLSMKYNKELEPNDPEIKT